MIGMDEVINSQGGIIRKLRKDQNVSTKPRACPILDMSLAEH